MRNETLKAFLATLFFLGLFGREARAYYDPGAQRWINRDPINERGFDLHNYPRAARKSYYGHDYAFLRSSPIDLIDPLGLIKWGGSCKKDDIDAIKKGYAGSCKKAKDGGCFKCLGDAGKKAMEDACDSKDGTGPEVECEDGGNNRCQTTTTGPGCGWTDPRGERKIHICVNQASSECPGGGGCTLLHEAAHKVGGVGADDNTLSPDNKAYDIERCAGCGN